MIQGRNIQLRLVVPDDAGTILALRLDQRRNQHLSAISPDVDAQRRWIEQYKEREAHGIELYYLIVANEPIGALRLYDSRGDSFSWGSWIIQPGAPATAAIESAMLVYEHGFYTLGFSRSHFEVRKANAKVIAFHERFGADRVSEDELHFHYTLAKEAYGRGPRVRYRRFIAEPSATPP